MPKKTDQSTGQLIQVYRRLLGYLRPYVPTLLMAMACMLVLGLATGLYGYLVGPLLEYLMTGGEGGVAAFSSVVPGFDLTALPKEELRRALPLLVLGIATVKALAHVGQFYLMGMTGQRVVVDLRRDLFRHLLGMSPGWFIQHHSGDLISRFTHDVQKVEMAVTYAVSSIIRDAIQAVVLLIVAFILDWRLSLIAFGVLPAIAVPVVRFARRLRTVTSQSNTVMGGITEMIHEAVGGVRVVQAYGMEDYEASRFDGANATFVEVMKKSFFVRAVSTPTMEVLGVGGVAAMLWYATGEISAGKVAPAAFLSFFATVMLLYRPVKSLGRLGQFVVTGAASAERIFEILDEVPSIQSREGAPALAPLTEALRFEGVSLTYPDGTKALDAIDLTIEAGQVVALVGPSGGGKTSLINLIPRFWDVTEGKVTLDGVDLREVRLDSLRDQIAIVSQETIIFNDTVRANVGYGRPGVDDSVVWDALDRAHARDFVEGLSEGLDTPLGERGVTLSGGQRQRIAIARALLKNAPILILDEATSALDTESERAVQAALASLMKGRTAVVIAHRLSTIRDADRIVVIEDGRVVETGDHGSLLAEDGVYRRLHDLQLVDQTPTEATG